MPEERFGDVMTAERERLHHEREELFARQRELDQKLAAINRELSAIDVYEAAKSGKLATSGQPRTPIASRAPRGSKRNEVLKLIEESEGLTRGEILQRMGLRGNKSGEMSVSNTLSALAKSNQVVRREGRYRVARTLSSEAAEY
jgi:hypothetical protein